jgi:hypothetical protein
MAENQHGTFVISGGKSIFDPVAHGIFMFPEQPGDLFHRVAAVNFNESGIGVAFSHSLTIIANFHAFRKPCLYLIFQPTYSPCPQIDRPRKSAFLDTKING